MESNLVKNLRRKFCIYDSRNDYTEEEIMDVSTRKMYVVSVSSKPFFEGCIEHKEVYGFVSNDKNPCIFIKDNQIKEDEIYRPKVLVSYCLRLKKGVYLDRANNVIYCTTENLQYSLDYMVSRVKDQINFKIKEFEKSIEELRNKLNKVTVAQK